MGVFRRRLGLVVGEGMVRGHVPIAMLSGMQYVRVYSNEARLSMNFQFLLHYVPHRILHICLHSRYCSTHPHNAYHCACHVSVRKSIRFQFHIHYYTTIATVQKREVMPLHYHTLRTALALATFLSRLRPDLTVCLDSTISRSARDSVSLSSLDSLSASPPSSSSVRKNRSAAPIIYTHKRNNSLKTEDTVKSTPQ